MIPRWTFSTNRVGYVTLTARCPLNVIYRQANKTRKGREWE